MTKYQSEDTAANLSKITPGVLLSLAVILWDMIVQAHDVGHLRIFSTVQPDINLT